MSETKTPKPPAEQHLSRVIFENYAGPQAPCVVVFCGIHGNEKAGLKAVEKMRPFLEMANLEGSLFVLSGNIPALMKNQRFIDLDLNRVWLRKMNALSRSHGQRISESRDRKELLRIIAEIRSQVKGALYFIDVHTTSAASIPFITIDDSLINRRYTSVFPVPVVLGIEEYLNGALLSFINQLGFVSLGFEAGKHDDEQAVLNAEAFLYLAMAVAGVITLDADRIDAYRKHLEKSARGHQYFFEVTYKYAIQNGEAFEMCPGFRNFQRVRRGEVLAHSNGKAIRADKDALIFMPLYQEQGEDGFFFVRKLPYWVLRFSALFRLMHLDSMLAWLPGVSWIDREKIGLRVDLKTARYMAKSVFHFLGYREVVEDEGHLLVYNRERNARKERYPLRYPRL